MLPPGASPFLVVMSMRAEVRNPYCAGSAPVTSETLPMNDVSRIGAKPLMPSGSGMPFIRYCMKSCSLRTWNGPSRLPALSWWTPGACRSTFPRGWLSPCGKASMASWLSS